MKYLKILGLAAVAAAALMAFAGNASATELTSPSGTMVTTGTTITAKAEGHAVLDPPFGKIECNSEVSGKTTTTGNEVEEPTVRGSISTLTFTNCTNGAVVSVIKPGELVIHTQETKSNKNGTLTSNGAEVTVELLGTHCVFKTTETDIGTLTGSTNTGGTATLDIIATIPRTGGRSGAFCGSAAQWTGSYKVESPDFLDVD